MPDERNVVQNEFGFKTMIRQATFGRDAGKFYMITEWPAQRAEEWGIRMAAALTRGGLSMPAQSVFGQGWQAVVTLGIDSIMRGQVNADEIIPLMQQLMECVKMIRDPKARDKDTGQPVVSDIVSNTDIMETQTRGWLKSEVIWLHVGFSPADALSKLISILEMTSASWNIPTSRPQSDSQ